MMSRKLIAIAVLLLIGFLISKLLPFLIVFVGGGILTLVLFVLILGLLIYGIYRLIKWGFAAPKE